MYRFTTALSATLSTIATIATIATVLTLAACAAPVAAQTAVQAPAATATAPAPAFHSTRFIVTTAGSGPDVILIPGLGCSRDVWKDEAAKLQAHYTLHFIQIRGFAGFPAGANASGPLLKPIVADLASYIETQHLMRPAVIGHSLGGLLGLMLADQHPQDVGKLMVVDAAPFFAALSNPKATVEDAQEIGGGMRGELMDEPQDKFLHVENAYIATLVRTESKRSQVLFWTVNSDRHTLTNALYEDVTTDLLPDMPKIETPITLLYALNPDRQTIAETDRQWHTVYAQAPHATLVRIDDTGHFIMLDQPVKFDDQVQKFLKQ